MRKKMLIIGGDKRFIFVRKILSGNFETIPFSEKESTIFSYSDIESADIVLLPYPITFDSVSINAPLYNGKILLRDVFSHLKPHQILLTGGKLPIEFEAEKICKTYDYTADEELLWANAELTAEGLLRLVIQELPTSLTATNVAVIGNGRVACTTARLLRNVGCKVTLFARNPGTEREKKYYKEAKALPLGDFVHFGHTFDCVINSVPSLVLNETRLGTLKAGCILFEAASSPYGIDFNFADRRNLKTIIAGSLPGKTSPETAAEIICKSVRNFCLEGG